MTEGLWGIVIGSIITGLGAVLVAWLTRRFNRSHAIEQAERDRQNQQVGLAYTDRAIAYGELDEWVSTVTERADDICFSSEVTGLLLHQRNYYGVCVAMSRGPLRPPKRGRYLWSPLVAQRVRILQDQAIAMAQLVVVDELGPDDEHGHDALDETADFLRQAMSDHLEGRDERSQAMAQIPRPRSSGRWNLLNSLRKDGADAAQEKVSRP